MRLFIALPLEESLNQSIFQITTSLRSSIRATWVAPHHYHLTLQFLGEVDPQLVKLIDQQLSDIPKLEKPITCCFQSITYFPDQNRPKALVLSLLNNPILMMLGQTIHQKMTEINFPPKSPFVPHVTLARFKQYFGPGRSLPGAVSVFKTIQIHRFALIQSTLSSTGPTYSEIKSYSVVKGS